MSDTPRLVLKRMIGQSNAPDPDDIMVTKRSLSRLGHYESPDWGLTGIPDRSLFDGIRSFQKERGLKIDGVMKPSGETAHEIGVLLSPPLFQYKKSPSQVSDSPPSEEECDYLYWKVDIPTCRAIERRRGKRAAANCYHTATARYGACLSGTPIDKLPPLNTWNQ